MRTAIAVPCLAHPGGAVKAPADAVGPGVTCYEVLGVLPTVSTQEIRRGYDSRADLLRPELVSGAPSTVVSAASRAQAILDSAWSVLSDPERRAGYDEAIGIRHTGEGLARRQAVPSAAGLSPSDFGLAVGAGEPDAVLLEGLLAVADFLSPHPRPPRRVTVPDVRGRLWHPPGTRA